MHVYDIASVVGRSSGSFWMEATDFVYGNALAGKFEKVGVVILIRSGDGYVNLGGFGREMLSKIHEEMKHLGPQDAQAVKTLLIDIGKMFSDVSVEIMMFGLCGEQVLICGAGGGGASLLREGNLGKILSTNMHVDVAVGELKSGDVLVLASRDFYEKVVYSDLKMVLSQGLGDSYGLASSLASQMAVLVQDAPVGMAMSALVLVVSERKSVDEGDKKEKKIEKLTAFWKKIAGSGVYLKDRFGVDPKQRKKRRFGFLVLGLILITLLVSLGVRARNSFVAKREEKVAQVIGPVDDLISEANEVLSVNKLRSRSLLLTAKKMLTEGQDQFPEKSEERKMVAELLKKVEMDYEKISGEIKVEPNIFLDLSLVSSGFVGAVMASYEDKVLVLSDVSGVLMEIEAGTKKAKVLAGGIEEGKLTASGQSGDFVLTEGGVVKIEDGSVATAISKEDSWSEIVGFGVFGSNVYVLDKGVGEIWKYVPSDGGYVSRRWLAPGVNPNFEKVTDMYIDGDIWVLDSDGLVRTYSGGVPKGVELTGLADSISEAKALAVTENGVWILDRGGKRLVGFDRNGVYQTQYIWEGFSLVSDVVVFSDNDKEVILMLSGEKIYEIGL